MRQATLVLAGVALALGACTQTQKVNVTAQQAGDNAKQSSTSPSTAQGETGQGGAGTVPAPNTTAQTGDDGGQDVAISVQQKQLGTYAVERELVLHAGPTMASDKVGTVPAGKHIRARLKESHSNWTLIRFADGREVYVFGKPFRRVTR